jgi:uncharacterized protein (TIGR02270 family)
MSRTASHARAWRGIYEQQAMDTAALWHLHAIAVDQPDYRPDDLTQLEHRIDNRLNALMHHPDLGWDVCEQALEWEQGGESFAAAMIAFHRDDSAHITQALEAGFTSHETFRGLASALSWLPEERSSDWTQTFMASRDLDHQHLALASCEIRAQDPGQELTRLLQRDDCRAHTALFARCLRLAGVFKHAELAPGIDAAIGADDEGVRFWAIWSSLLLGLDRTADLKPYVLTANPWQRHAVQLAFRVLAPETAKEWIDELAQNATHVRHVLKAIMTLGDPDAMPWLIEAMQKPLLARLAGEAFSTLTGCDLTLEGLAVARPPASIDPLDDQDPDVILEDDKLPWPDPDVVADTWKRAASHYRPGERYFLGQPIAHEHLHRVLKGGYQRQRHAAALEMALRHPGLPLPNTCARQVAS